MSPRGGGGLVSRWALARDGCIVGLDGSGGSRKRKKRCQAACACLRHVIRPSRARAFPARAPPLSPHFPSPPPARAAGLEPWKGRSGPPPALKLWLAGPRRVLCAPALAAAPRRSPNPSWVMSHEHLHRVTFRSRTLSRVCAFLTCRFSRLEFPLCPLLLSATISYEA